MELSKEKISSFKWFASRAARLKVDDYTLCETVKVRISKVLKGAPLKTTFIRVGDVSGIIEFRKKGLSRPAPFVFYWLVWGVFIYKKSDSLDWSDVDLEAYRMMRKVYPSFAKEEFIHLFKEMVEGVPSTSNEKRVDYMMKKIQSEDGNSEVSITSQKK